MATTSAPATTPPVAAAPKKVPESVRAAKLRKRKERQAFRVWKAKVAARSRLEKREVIRRSAKTLRAINGIRQKEKSSKRLAAVNKQYFVPAEAPVAFVIRIRGICEMAPKDRKILQLLRLRQLHHGVFIKLTNATIQMLNRVNPYIAWGYPSYETIRKLVLKRGYLKVRGQRRRIVANDQISTLLGKKAGLICADDLIFQLATCGPKFKAVTNSLWPFKLSAPRGGLHAKRRHFVEGGDYGNREEYINKLILRML